MRDNKGKFVKGHKPLFGESAVSTLCLLCKKNFIVPAWKIKVGQGKFCGIICSQKFPKKNTSFKTRLKQSLARTGKYILDKHPNWKGGRSVSSNGYMRIYIDSKKRVLEHRFIMEQKLGRKLKSQEIVHHINKNKLDNNPKNLQLIESQSQHASLTFRERNLLGRFI